MGTNERKMYVCTWTEKENGKGNIYIPSCLGNSSNGVNIFKVAKKYKVSLIDIFRSCPYCGNNVVINAVKIPEKE
jgi:hypothetical protein